MIFPRMTLEECKKLFTDKGEEINQKGGSNKWVGGIRV